MPNYAGIEDHLSRVALVMQERPYQLGGVMMGRKRRWFLVELIMGSGKTLIALTTIFCFKPDRILILCPKNAFWTWLKNAQRWFPGVIDMSEYAVVEGTPEKRRKIWGDDSKRVFVSTYDSYRIDQEYIHKTLKLDFNAVVADEIHKLGKYKRGNNKKTDKLLAQKYKALYELLHTYKPAIFCGMSGKLRRKGPQDLWHYLHLVDPKMWSSYHRFVGTFCEVAEGFWGQEIVGPKNTKALAEAIKPYVYTTPNAEKYLPPIQRQYLWVEMTDEQKRIYEQLEEQRYAVMDSGDIIWANNPLALFTRHRQLLISPRLLDPAAGIGAGIEGILDHADDVDNDHFVIWTAYPAAIPIITDGIRQHARYSTRAIYSLKGGAKFLEVQEAEEGFRRDPESLFIGSIAFAQSFELETSQLEYTLGPSWILPENEQAEARLRRTTTTELINSFFVNHFGTVDDRVYEVLDNNGTNVRDTYRDAQDFESYWTGKKLS